MQFIFPIQLCIAASPDYSDSHHRGCTEVFKKLRSKGKTVPQRSESKAPRFTCGWTPFMQNTLSSQPAACRKGKQLYIAQRDRLPQWVSKLTKLEDKYTVWGRADHSQGAVSSQPGSRGQARAASSVEKIYIAGGGAVFLFFVHCGLTCFVVLGDPWRIFQGMDPVAPSLQLQALVGSSDMVMVGEPAFTEISTLLSRAHTWTLNFKS